MTAKEAHENGDADGYDDNADDDAICNCFLTLPSSLPFLTWIIQLHANWIVSYLLFSNSSTWIWHLSHCGIPHQNCVIS
jgi:hypothetical protein